MDKAISYVARFLIYGKQAVFMVKALFESDKGASQVFGTIIVVVQVDLDFSVASPAQFGEDIQIFLPVFFLRIKEAVFQNVAARVAEGFNAIGVVLEPSLNPSARGLSIRLVPVRFEMVADAQQDVPEFIFPVRIAVQPPQGLEQIEWDPVHCGKKFRDH